MAPRMMASAAAELLDEYNVSQDNTICSESAARLQGSDCQKRAFNIQWISPLGNEKVGGEKGRKVRKRGGGGGVGSCAHLHTLCSLLEGLISHKVRLVVVGAELAEHGLKLLHGQFGVPLQVEHLLHLVKVGGVESGREHGVC